MNDIEKFIQLLRESSSIMTDIFTKGSCGHLYFILKHLYPDAVAYDDEDHVITRINDKFYDITGEVRLKRHISKTDKEMEKYKKLKYD